jgi:hypothetical protein
VNPSSIDDYEELEDNHKEEQKTTPEDTDKARKTQLLKELKEKQKKNEMRLI